MKIKTIIKWGAVAVLSAIILCVTYAAIEISRIMQRIG